MTYKILADAAVLIHFIWILFLIFGAFLGVRNKVIKIIHVSGLAFASVIQAFDWYCPLTYLEVWLKSKYTPGSAYEGPFLIHYIEKFVYVDISRNVIVVLTILLCLLNGWIYLRKR